MAQRDTGSPTEVSARSPRRWALLVFLLFFLSGMTSLVYQVVWVRKFGLVFGVTTYAVSTVLAAFFAGLAVGSFLAGRLIDRTRLHPLLVYGLMEGCVGVYALLLPLFLQGVEATYPLIYTQVAGSFSLFTLYRFLVSFVLLAIPTTLMGATLPVLSKLMVDREEVLGLGVGQLYAANTFGAVAGTFFAGFALIPALGVSSTTLAAAIGNFLLAGVAVLLSFTPELAPVRRAREGAPAAPTPIPLTRTDRIILALAFTSGLTILALEVVWTRSLVLILGSTTYAFSSMVTAVLVGIAAGSAAIAPIADRVRNRGALVALLLFVGGFCAVMGPAIINRLPFVFLGLYDYAYGVWELLIAVQFIVCFLVVFVPTFLSGASFPILVKMYSRGEESVGRTVADVYAVNTFGGILGSLAGGFVLIKFLGLQPALTTAALVLMALGGLLAMAIARPWGQMPRRAVAVGMALVVVLLVFVHPRFQTKLLFAGWGPYAGGYYASRMAGYTVDVTDRYMQGLLYHEEGVTASVDVMEDGWGDRIISVNAKPVATTYLYDMRALRMLGHLPVLLHPNPRDVLIIGLGAGVSSGIICTYPTVEEVTTVELCEEVPGGAAQFAEWNHNVLENPKLKLVINDGANYVKATRKQYDVISADPIHPFVSGAGTLYSREHWEICKRRLRDGGIIAQWLPLYHLSAADFATVVGTFSDVFPNCSMWFCGIDTVIIGAKGDLKVDPERMGSHMSDPTVMQDLLDMGVHSPGDVLGWYVAGPEQMRRMGMGAVHNTTDYPILEFSAPKAISLTGVASTMPSLLSAVEAVPAREFRGELGELCTGALSAQTLHDASSERIAGRWLMRTQLLSSYNYTDQSLDAVRHAWGLRPNDRFIRRAVADAQYALGETRLGDGYPREAYDLFYDSYLNDPQNVISLTSAVRAAIQLGDIELGERTLELAAEGQQDVFQVLVYEGVLALRRESWSAAQRAFEAAEAGGQESPTTNVGLGFLALRAGRREEAEQRFARAMEIATDQLNTLYDIVDLCTAHGFGSDARAYAPQLIELASGAIASDPGQPSLYATRALGYSALGEDHLADRDRRTQESLIGWWGEQTASDLEPISPAVQ